MNLKNQICSQIHINYSSLFDLITDQITAKLDVVPQIF